jgi:hypothetical protein
MNGPKYDDTVQVFQLETAEDARSITEYREKVERVMASAGASDQTLMDLNKA